MVVTFAESNSLVIMLGAVVAGVILTLSAITVFLHCHKQRLRNEKETKEETMEDSGEEEEDEEQWEGMSDQSLTGCSQYTESRGVSQILIIHFKMLSSFLFYVETDNDF